MRKTSLFILSLSSVSFLFATSQIYNRSKLASTQHSTNWVSHSLFLPILVFTGLFIASTVRRAHLRLFSPAKINEFLKVSRPARPDGFHNLISVFQAVSLGDSIRMSLAPVNREYDLVVCDNPEVPTDDSNLVIRSLKEFRARTGLNKYFNVEIKKRIPMGAGLGGGSSNAATALFGANQLTGFPLNPPELSAVGATIGSDVSFFLASTGRALCEGRGEIVTDLKSSGMNNLVIFLLPGVHCATGPVFKNFSNMKTPTYVSLNDLEAPACELHPQLSEVKEFLISEHVEQVTMSGSGSSFYGFVSDEGFVNLKQRVETKFPRAQVHAVQAIEKQPGREWFDEKQAQTNHHQVGEAAIGS